MTDGKSPESPDPDDIDTEAILRRRDFLVKSALLAATASVGAACAEEPQACLTIPDSQAEVCLSVDTYVDAQPEACLSDTPQWTDVDAGVEVDADAVVDATAEIVEPTLDTGRPRPEVCLSDTPQRPEVCLSPPIDTGQDSASDGTTPKDAGPDPAPEVCLSPPLPDATSDSDGA